MEPLRLGSLATSERLIQDLYLDLRRKTRVWSSITKQTAQARMGYIGQHLVSVVTGCPGGKSGARGLDLIHLDGSFGEIKTCYRVDQLGKCGDCAGGVAPHESACAICGSANVQRKDDSKWLLSFRNEREFAEMLDPTLYYLVLFEFTDLGNPDTIQASIWTVDPKSCGFLLCLVDYYINTTGSGVKLKAPFNWWPYSIYFELMRPLLIYRATIASDDTIRTTLFPGRDAPQPHLMSPMNEHARARSVKTETWEAVAGAFGCKVVTPRKASIDYLETIRMDKHHSNTDLCDAFARHLYGPRIRSAIDRLPERIRLAVALSLKMS